MSVVYRAEKGAPLTSEELDGNFRELETRLHLLEENPEGGEGLAKVNFDKERLTFTGSFGTDFGSFPLPKPILPFRGEWLVHTSYQKHDLVIQKADLYECLDHHISTEWHQDSNQWKCLLPFQKSKESELPLFEKATLPHTESLGKIALLIEEGNTGPIFFNGSSWQYLMKGDTL